MSMISGLIDELRRYADRADGTFPMLASALRDAADTIWQLRDDLQQAHKRLADAEHDESRAWDRVRKADAEADRLREQLAKARDPQRIGGTADPESFVYAIEQLREFRWQHATNDEDAIPYINNVAAAHERENAKLRELCKDMMAFVEDDDACKRCGHDAECVEAADGELVLPYEGRCLMLDLFADRMRELGIEVDG